MAEKKMEKAVEVILYIAEDGTEFASKCDCERYEAENILRPKLIDFKIVCVPEGCKLAEGGNIYIAKITSIDDFSNFIKYYSLTNTRLDVNYVIGKYYRHEFDGKYIFIWSQDYGDFHSLICDTVEWLKNDLINARKYYDTAIAQLDTLC